MKAKHSLIIVDDEPHVRTLLRNCIDWDAIGIEIVAEAGTADEALCLFARLRPEIACLDVCMPVNDGIKLAGDIRKMYPGTEIVVVSGHDDFSYAQQFIRIGVADYLLKPINEECLSAVMGKIAKRLDEGDEPAAATEPPIEAEAVQSRQGNAIIREIVSFIEKNYRDQELSLQFLAERYSLNPTYICRAFKQETGENWVDFLTRRRMARAMELIRTTDKRNYEIAQEIGFSDAKYFSTCFKNFVGVTVNDFRKGKEIGK